ncbi:MAG: hypothetical protein ACP6IY_10025 [Promethearchaeia archaeon]
MDPIAFIIAVFSLLLGIFNLIFLIYQFILSKAPVIEFNFLKNERKNEVRFYLKNIGQLRGKLIELKIYDPIDKKYINLLIEKDLQILYPQQRTNRDFFYNYKFICEKLKKSWIELEFITKIQLKVLWFKKEYPRLRTYVVECD